MLYQTDSLELRNKIKAYEQASKAYFDIVGLDIQCDRIFPERVICNEGICAACYEDSFDTGDECPSG